MTDTTSAAPSDAEIDALDDQFRWDTTQGRRDYARAVLARWGAPQPDMTTVVARAKQEAIAAYLSRFGDEPQPVARVPLTDEQINAIHQELCNTVGSWYGSVARAVEAAHGIGTEKGDSHG